MSDKDRAALNVHRLTARRLRDRSGRLHYHRPVIQSEEAGLADESQAELIRMAQMMAHGYLIDLLLATQFAQHPKSAEAADNLIRLVDATAQPMKVPGVSAATGEAMAQAFHDTIVGHIERARAMAVGEPIPAGSGASPIREH